MCWSSPTGPPRLTGGRRPGQTHEAAREGLLWVESLTELSPTLLEFIRRCIPSYQVAEVLLAVAAQPDRDFTSDEIVGIMRPVEITELAARRSLAVLTACGLLRQHAGRFTYSPSPELAPCTQELIRAYNERPVTLIRAIYRNEDRGIQSFADAFKL